LLVVKPGQGITDRNRQANNAMVIELQKEGDHYEVVTLMPDASDTYLVSGGKTLLWRRSAVPQASLGGQPPHAPVSTRSPDQDGPGRSLGQSQENIEPDDGENKASEDEPSQRVTQADEAETALTDEEISEALEAFIAELKVLDPSGRLALRLQKQIKNAATGQREPGAEGQYFRRLIEIAHSAIASGRGRHVLNHEVIHALKDLNLFTAEEWTALEKAAVADKDLMARIARAYPELSRTKQIEEAIAELFASFRTGNVQAKGFLRTAMEKIQAVWDALVRALQGRRLPSRETARRVRTGRAESVMVKIGTGEVGSRESRTTRNSEPKFAAAWHGTPHDFDEFDMSKIGTGEGHQVYGHGLYFAGNRDVAEHYREQLSGGRVYGTVLTDHQPMDVKAAEEAADYLGRNKAPLSVESVARRLRAVAAQAIEEAKAQREVFHRTTSDAVKYTTGEAIKNNAAKAERYKRIAVQLEDGDMKMSFNPAARGRTFKVDLAPRDEEWLDWDKPLKDQSSVVKDKLQPFIDEWMARDQDPDPAYKLLAEFRRGLENETLTGEQIYRAIAGGARDSVASDRLRSAGVPGIRYADQFSRNIRILSPKESTSGKWVVGERTGRNERFDTEAEARARYNELVSHNYVVFDTAHVKVEAKFSRRVPEVAEKPRDPSGKFESAAAVEKRKPKGSLAQQKAINKALAPTKKGGLWTRVREAYDTMRERAVDEFLWGIADEFHGLRKLGKELHPEARDRELGSYVAARLARHAAGQIEALLRHGAPKWNGDDGVVEIDGKSPGFYEIVAPLYQQGLDRLFEGYAYARRVKTQKLIEDGREHNLTADERDALIELEQEFPIFREVFDQIQTFKKAVLDTSEGMGLINKEQRATWEQADHVPFYRAVEDEKTGPGGKRGLAGQSPQIRRLTGGEETFAVVNDATGEVVARFDERKDAKAEAKKLGKGHSVEKAGQPIVGVIENLAKNFSHLMDAAMKNHAAQLAIDEAVAAGWAEKVPMAQTQALVPQSVMKSALEKIGMKVQGEADGMSAVSAIASPVHPGNDVVAIRRDGKTEYYRVEDKFVLKALQGLHRASMAWWTKPLVALKTILTRSITAMPGFMVRNFVRDSQGAWIQTEERGYNFLNELGKSVKGLATSLNDPKVRAIMAAGGDTGWYKNAPEDIVEQLRQLETDRKASILSLANPMKMLRLWERLGRASELANRVVAFDETVKATGSTRQGAFESADLLDFQLRGGAEWFQWFASTVPFLNARVQGLYKLGRAGLSKTARKKFMTKAGMVATFSIVLALINADDEDYNDLPEWRKDLFWNLPVHKFYGKDVAEKAGLPMFLMIPKPFELGLLFGTGPELAVRAMTGTADGKEVLDALRRALVDTFAINPAGNPLIKESYEQWANKDFFTGDPIVNQTLQYLPPEQQFDSRTTEVSKRLGELLKISPARLQHAIRGFTGDFGMYILGVGDAVAEALDIAPPAAEKRLDERDIFRSFMSQANPRTTKWVEKFYEIREEAETIARGVNARNKQGDREGAREMRKENRDLLASRKALDATADTISALNKQMRDVKSSETMSPEQKRLELDRLSAKKNKIAKAAAQRAEDRRDRSDAE
jgi:hypothetical protein